MSESNHGRTMWDFLAEVDDTVWIVALMVLLGAIMAISESWQKAKSSESKPKSEAVEK